MFPYCNGYWSCNRLNNMAYFILLLKCIALGLLLNSAKAEAFQKKDKIVEIDSLDGASQLLANSIPLMSYTEIRGGEIANEQTLRFNESPFVVRSNIEIGYEGRLIIEPGVTVEFAPRVGITVKGILQAVGTSSSRIILRAQGEQTISKFELSSTEEKRIRLVDGPTPVEGRLELYHKGSWRSVCTNSKNWTQTDYKVACKQLGFRGGNFWNWVDRAPGFMPRLLYEYPACKGFEKSLQDCGWHSRQLGSGVCDYHSDIGIQCLPIHSEDLPHWRGIRFENAPFAKSLATNNIVYSALSKSTLKYVTIYKAGLGDALTARSGVEILGQPPVMEHVVISHSAYTGLNVTRPNDGFTFKNITIRESNGIGVFVNSSQGNMLMEKCNIENNADDGIKYVGHDLRAEERTDRATIYDFCTLPTTSGQTYPISLTFTQKYYAGSDKECGKYFFTKPGFLLTVHFEFFSLKNNETMLIQIFDGATSNDRILFEWKARNYTRPQSVTSTREKLFIRMKANMREESNAFIRLTSGKTNAYDLRVVDSIIENNGGRGVAFDNIRSKLHIDRTSISRNGRVAGVHITSGAGDVNITSSKISFNNGDGVNITYYGGNRNISKSTLYSNKRYGLSVWLNDTTDTNRIEYIPFNQTTVVEYSQISCNIETGILHGNFCDPMWINITGNTFNSSFNNDINIGSCWKFTKLSLPNLKLQIGHNIFEFSQKNSIYMSPILNTEGKIEYNHFFFGSFGSIYLRNGHVFPDFNMMPVRLLIQSNHFIRNKGLHVVSLGLSPYSRKDLQSLLFTRNFLRENKIVEPFGPAIDGTEGSDGAGRLNPRSRVSAAVIVASSNIDIFRNILHNLDSTYEIGSQLCDQSQIINATYNWLGHTDENKIYARLFHRNDRYNLARIQYIPYLLHSSNPGSSTIIAISTMVPRFFDETTFLIGGEVDGQEMIPSGTYTVSKDINIRPGGKLILQPGVILKFEPSVGMMIAGKLEARGRRPDDILFTLKRETIIDIKNNTSDLDNESEIDAIDAETESIMESNDLPRIPLRLLGGSVANEGRLQIYLDGRWGTVCDYGWTEINAALVCNQLGYTLNPTDWRLFRSEIPMAGIDEDVIVSNIQCTEEDIDITKCKSERLSRSEFENSCSHENDVGIRCYEGAWAGLRFSMLAERTDMQYITIEKAGLFDYTTNSFKPAIQMDFARHNLDNVRVVDNLHDGLGIIYSDIYAGKSVNNIKNCEFIGNRGSGISFKQLEMRVQGSVIKSNHGSGISHDPVISAVDQTELAGWFKISSDFNTFDFNYVPYIFRKDSENIDLGPWENKYLRTEEVFGDLLIKKVIVRCPAGYVLGIQLLNPININSTERLTILDSQTENDRSDIWSVNRDLNVFPITSSSYGIIIYYESGLNAIGGAVLLLSTVAAPVQNIRNKIVRGPAPSLYIQSTKIQKNARGITAFYYNRYYGNDGEYYLRKSNESIKVINSEISYNEKEAIFIKSPYWDVQSSNISEITIHVNGSMITQNGRGIRQLSKDLRSSNNIFHYVIQDTTIEENAIGGFQVSLPYVWQYNENFTHSVYFGNSTWQRNKLFSIEVTGHYSVLNITSNVFLNNVCPRGLIALNGMEKRIKINNNKFENNNAKFIMEFKADSLSEIIGDVPARVEYNTIKDNSFEEMFAYIRIHSKHKHRKKISHPNVPTAVIRLEGIQNVILYRNLIANNKMQYNLVAGLMSARLDNYFFATENWWGSKDVNYIESKIFDFDNWNDHADVIFQPFLIEDNFDASVSLIEEGKNDIDLDTFKGGRIHKDFVIRKQIEPYHIISDITVLPGVTLTIQHGVQMEFEPNVGILVLGNIVAIGYKESEIIMRPFKNMSHESYTFVQKRSIEDMSLSQTNDAIRLCIGNNCTNDSDSLMGSNEGFLEYFNHTTLQWVPICDSRFTERNAQVVCRELGFDPSNVFYAHDRRVELHTNSLTRIWTWVQPLECKGDEARMGECTERLNGQLYGHRHQCKWDDVFVFVSCNEYPEESVYWGGIRFANSKFEENQYETRFHDTYTHTGIQSKESLLEFVRIENAGVLHNHKNAALQAVFKNPKLSSVTIVNSAHHGINFVAPTGAINLNFVNVTNAFGTGINVLSLTGEGRESDESSFTPLKKLDLPYKLFSMIDICDPQKAHTVEERTIVYYKYDNNPVNCVKIFTSAYRAKPVGFRLLQSNLFNHSKLYGRADSIKLFDGDIYNVTAFFIDKIEYDSKNQRSFFKSTGPALSIQLIASGAPEYHGFIAEIVTVPISTIGQYRDALHNVTNSHIVRSSKGAISYLSVGEITPTLTLSSNRLQNNCKQLYGNFSTCDSAISIDVQNMNSFFFMNNLLYENQGGLRVRADSRGSATSLRGLIQHNLFLRNRNRPALYVEGRQSSPYQEVVVYRNYFAQNEAGYEDIIKLLQVVSNFSYNFVHANIGGRIVEISGFEKVRLPIYQTTSHNGFYGNVANNWMGKSTIVAGTAGQQYVDNIFENPENDYEIMTINNTVHNFDTRNSTIEHWRSKIDARYNYWSYNNSISVQSRIRDKHDDQLLLEVQAVPFRMNNESIVDGKCPPGWNLVHDTCYIYVGAPMRFHEARDFCRSENSSMPFIRTDATTVWNYLQSQMQHLKYPEKVWVQDINRIDRCTSFVFREIEVEDCFKELGFLCESDPKVVIDPLSWRADVFAISIISAFVLAIILLLMIGFCWYAKSKHRHVQRLQRRNSIRQSLRSLNSLDPQGSLRRKNFNVSESTGTLSKNINPDYKQMVGNGSLDSMDKSVLSSEASFEGYDCANGYQRTQHFNEYVNQKVLRAENAQDKSKIATIGSASKALVNRGKAVAAALDYNEDAPDLFELSYRNEGFRDNSTITDTRNNSVRTSIAEDTPIIHQTDIDDNTSDYYGNASTLPLRSTNNENLSFLAELKRNLPEYYRSNEPTHTSFLPNTEIYNNSRNNDNPHSSSLPYEQKIDNLNFTPLAQQSQESLIRNDKKQPAEMRRPDSYYTAVRSSKAPLQPSILSDGKQRPKTVYHTANNEAPSSYHRSKSEALLETDFDNGNEHIFPLNTNGRSYSQPLETAM